MIDAHRLIKEAKSAAEKSAQLSLGVEKKLKDVQDRVAAMEDSLKETTATTEDSIPEEEDDTKQQIHDLLENYEVLRVAIFETLFTV